MKLAERNLSEYSNLELKDIGREFKDLCVITQTYYGTDETSKVRQKLALDFFANAKKLGLKIMVVDGGSNEDFLNQVREDYANTVELLSESDIPKEDKDETRKVGMGTGRRYGFSQAFKDENTKYFLWSEPEKSDLLTVDNLRNMLASLKTGEVDVTVPKRLLKESMVPIQAWLESWANKIAAKLLAEKKHQKLNKNIEEVQRPLDLWFGPKVFNRKGAEFFLHYRSNLNKWDSIIAPASNAEVAGLSVNSADVIYNYDLSQIKNEVGNSVIDKKRWEQFFSILHELGSKEAGEFYQRITSGENLNHVIPEAVIFFQMNKNVDVPMPEDIKTLLKIEGDKEE
jgi:hypothetical protein